MLLRLGAKVQRAFFEQVREKILTLGYA